MLQPEHGFCQQNEPECGQVLARELKTGGGSRFSSVCVGIISY